ncbi:pyridoxamine 5'-phosphate oxidase family protein [candidate division KSB1 bacterium]|nr:pyridoxamine 5'-phosphate oxidase family protein [candidate division KSB1 bacterium]
MRRSDKEIQGRREIDRIIAACAVCRLALARDNEPYIVPLSFGYDGRSLYFHTAAEGKKIVWFLSNPRVSFEFEHEVKLISDPHTACRWTLTYESVIGMGTIRPITDPQEKIAAMNWIMRHYSGKSWEFDVDIFSATRMWRVDIEELSGKRSRLERE